MKYAIIGAGISGLSAITKIQESKLASNITLFEKSPIAGGRLAAKFSRCYQFDSALQHIRINSREFSHFLTPIFNKGVLKPWFANFCVIDNNKARNHRRWSRKLSNMHYVATPSMNKIADVILELALEKNNLQTKFNCEITKIKQHHDKLLIIDKNNNIYDDFDFVISTVAPQYNLNILPRNFQYLKNIKKKKMLGCYALMIALDKKPDIRWDAALIKNSKLSWISFDSSKPDRKVRINKNNKSHYCFLADSRNIWADNNIERDLEDVKEELIIEFLNILKMDKNNIIHSDIARWPYANIEKQYGAKSYFDKKLKIGVCGDWLIQGRVEAAFLSAMNLIEKINNN